MSMCRHVDALTRCGGDAVRTWRCDCFSTWRLCNNLGIRRFEGDTSFGRAGMDRRWLLGLVYLHTGREEVRLFLETVRQ